MTQAASYWFRRLTNYLQGGKSTRAIPFFNILSANISNSDITIQFAKPTSKDVVRVTSLNYVVEETQHEYARSWVAKLLDRAYGRSQRRKRIKVLVNPFGGQGNAQKLFLQDIEPIFIAAGCKFHVEKTSYQGHAVEIAIKLDIENYDVVASCSGDGLPHEVFNGLGKRQDARRALSKIAVVQLPCGSGNAMSLNCFGTNSTSLAALCTVKGTPTPLDLTSVTQGDRRTLSFLSQAVGIVADVDLGTENIRWMGSARFTYGFFVRIMRQTVYPCDLAVKIDIPDKAAIKEQYRKGKRERRPILESREDVFDASQEEGLPPLVYGTVSSPLPSSFTPIPGSKMGNFYAGNMALMAPDANFFPASLPSDGHLDLLTINGDISRVSTIKCFLSLDNGKIIDMGPIDYRKISAYRITPRDRSGYIAIDGERIPFEGFQAEVHKGLGTVLSRNGYMYEADGVVPRTI